MKAKVVAKSYRITMTTDQFADIMDRDEASFSVRHVPLYTRIEDLGSSISKVDYDGHFGPHIFVTILAGANEEKILRNVITLVEEYIGLQVAHSLMVA